jgi:hypothetical protein
MQRIFSSVAKGTYDAKKSSSGAGELKIYWTKEQASALSALTAEGFFLSALDARAQVS